MNIFSLFQFRIYQDAKMTLAKFSNSKLSFAPITAERQGVENKNLLDLSPSDVVFYVGGYPDSFTVSNQEDCIHVFTFN